MGAVTSREKLEGKKRQCANEWLANILSVRNGAFLLIVMKTTEQHFIKSLWTTILF